MNSYLPVFEIVRGDTVESIHFGSIAVCDADGNLIASYGNVEAITFMRSIAKPIQVLPLIENGGLSFYQFTTDELAIMCGSHSGMDVHVRLIESIQRKTGINEDELLCGTHPPIHHETARSLIIKGEALTSNRHNCSGNHMAILAYAKLIGETRQNYNQISHLVQQQILEYVAAISDLPKNKIVIGVDGCSIPTYGVSILSTAKIFSRLCSGFEFQSGVQSCKIVASAMTQYPDLIAGPNRLDTDLMKHTGGKMISKTGIEGYQAVGVFYSEKHNKPLGIAVKISDGDLTDRARPAIVIETLRQLGLLSNSELEKLSIYGPSISIYDSQKNVVGIAQPNFKLSYHKLP